LQLTLDALTHPLVRVLLPLLLAYFAYELLRGKFWAVLTFAAANGALDFLWLWYVTPLDCPLFKVCNEPAWAGLFGLTDGYITFWAIVLGIPALVLLVLLAAGVYWLRRLARAVEARREGEPWVR
jgi:hypothetical protein